MNLIVLEDLWEAQNVAFAVTTPITGKQMEYKDLIKDPTYREDWLLSKSNELCWLKQGVWQNKDGTQRIKGWDYCDAILKFEVEEGRIVTYATTICTVQPEKDESNQSQITTWGNLFHDYPENNSTDSAGIESIKIL